MKKRYLLCVLALCILLTACGNILGQTESAGVSFESSESMPGYDAQNQYMLTIGISFQETDDFFCGSNFFLNGNYLHYYDKISGISGVLCADPACTHDSSDCGAYVKAGANLSYYDGKLYWIEDSQAREGYNLWHSDLSGTNRKKVKRISFDDVILPYQPQQYVIHRENLYMLGYASVVEGTQSGLRVTLLSTPLDSSEEYSILFDETFHRGVNETFRFVGNSVYLFVMTFPEGGPFDVEVIKYDIQSGVSETVYEETEITEVPGAIWVTVDGEVYLPGLDGDRVYVWKLENGKRVEAASWESSTASVPHIMDGIVVDSYHEGKVRWVRIKDLTGETIYDGKLFPEGIPELDGDPNEYYLMWVGGDKDKLIINLQNFVTDGFKVVYEVDYTIMLDLNDNLKPTILWSSLTE